MKIHWLGVVPLVIVGGYFAAVGLSHIPFERIGSLSLKQPPAVKTQQEPQAPSSTTTSTSQPMPRTATAAKPFAPPEKPTLSGSFTLIDKDVSRTSTNCSGTGGFSDIEAGLQVVVKNEKNVIVGLGELGNDNYSGSHPEVVCRFPFTIKDVPKAKFYEIEVGRRGSLKFSSDDLNKLGWDVKFSMGGD